MNEATSISRMFHDLRNTLGAVQLNLEVAADATLSQGIALEAATDALSEARRLSAQIDEIRQAVRMGEHCRGE